MAALLRRTCVLLAACLSFSATAGAADPHGNFAVRGVGLETCGTFTAERPKQAAFHQLTLSWLNGYLSAYNQIAPDTYDVTAAASLDNLDARLADYCAANPDQSIAFAAIAVASILDPARIKASPDAPATEPQVDSGTLQRIQQALKARGHYTGSVDGKFGPGTRSALEAFQRGDGLPVTRVPDALTLARLFQ